MDNLDTSNNPGTDFTQVNDLIIALLRLKKPHGLIYFHEPRGDHSLFFITGCAPDSDGDIGLLFREYKP